MNILINVIGLALVIALIYAISWNRKKLPLKMVGKALLIQFIIAIILVKIPLGSVVVGKVSDFITAIINSGEAGNSFVFGSLGNAGSPTGFIFAIQVLGNVVFLSSLIGLLYYIGVLSFIIKWIGKGIGKLLGTSEVESFVAVANMFMGQTDSPILVSKYIGRMTDSEIMVVLVSGMSSMSVSILGGYAALGIPMEYLLIASTLVPIGSILVSKMILPETQQSVKIENVQLDNKGKNTNVIDAISEGAMTGVQVSLAIGGTLIAMVSLVAMLNKGFALVNLSLEQIFGYLFAPFSFFMGIESHEVLRVGELLGSKLVLNEFVAFDQLGKIITEMSPRTGMMVTISLCGFANFSSLGICVSGISILCPEKRSTLSRLVFRAMLGGVAVSLLSAMIIGLVMAV